VRDAVFAGRATVQNVSKYVLMGASSNFGNMFSMAGATLILPFLPMLPIQILLNNLIYNVSEIAIPFDLVDPEVIVRPVKWDIKLIERFMLVFGPVSSIFDFLTFYALLYLFGAGEALFHTGWFIESMTTQTLVVFCIRTRRLFFRSKAGRFLTIMNLGAVALAIILPMASWGRWFGFVAPPPLFYVFLVAATTAYLALVEITKRLFYLLWPAGEHWRRDSLNRKRINNERRVYQGCIVLGMTTAAVTMVAAVMLPKSRVFFNLGANCAVL